MTSITSELFEFNKMLFIYVITILVTFFWFFKIILIKKIIVKKTYLDIPILIFFISQLISTFVSIDVHTSIFGYYGRFNGGLLSIVCYIILYYALVSNFRNFSEKYLQKQLKIIVIGSLLVILWGLPGKFGHDLSCYLFSGQLNNNCWTTQFRPSERLFSTLGQPNWLGAYLAVTFFIGLYFYFKNKDLKYLVLDTLYLVLNLVTLLFTRSRSSMIGLGVGFLIFIPSYLFFVEKKYKKILIISVLFFITLVFCKTGIPQVDRFLDIKNYRFKKIVSDKSAVKKTDQKEVMNSDVTESGDIRKIVWQGAIALGKKNPWFGTGVETFAYAYYFVRPAAHNLTSEWDYLYNKAHNEYLNYFATTGYIGLAAYLGLIFTVVIYTIYQLKIQSSKLKTESDSSSRILVLSLICAYLTILITNFFGFSVTMINLFFYLLPAFIFILAHPSKSIEEEKTANYSFNLLWQKLCMTTLFLILLYTLIYIGRYFLADVNYAKSDSYYKIGNYQVAATYLNEALKFRYEHVYEDKFSYVLANLAFISAYQKQEDSAKQLVELAKYYNNKTLTASPKNSLYWKTKAKNYYLFYQVEDKAKDLLEAVKALKTAQIYAPTDPKISYSLSIFYSLLADIEKDSSIKKKFEERAIKEIETAMKLKPNDTGYKQLKEQLIKKL